MCADPAAAGSANAHRQGGKVSLVLQSGTQTPVSRTFTAEVKAPGLLQVIFTREAGLAGLSNCRTNSTWLRRR